MEQVDLRWPKSVRLDLVIVVSSDLSPESTHLGQFNREVRLEDVFRALPLLLRRGLLGLYTGEQRVSVSEVGGGGSAGASARLAACTA